MTVSLVKKVARNIRYHALPDWVGKQVVINGTDSIEHDLKQGLAFSILEQGTLIETDPKFRQGALSKYGILDLEFLVESGWVWNNEIRGIPLLKELHLVSPLAKDERGREVQRDMLEELSDQISQGKVYVLLFLTTKRTLDWKKHLLSLPDDYFPRTFLVEDACVTNTNWAWFNKHFYL